MYYLKNKKSSLLDFVIVIIFILGAIAILGQKDTIISTVGPKQLLMLHAYSEGEEYREYLQLAAKFSFLNAVEEEGVTSKDQCVVQINSQAFRDNVNAFFKGYVDAYRAGEQYLNFKATTGGGFKPAVFTANSDKTVTITIDPAQQFGGAISAPIDAQNDLAYSIDPRVITKVDCNTYLKLYRRANGRVKLPTHGG